MGASLIQLLRSERVMAVGPALAAVGAFAALPLVLWHGVFSDVLGSFHLSLSYLAVDLGPWLLLAAGVGLMVPVALSVGLKYDDRFYPRDRRSYFIWGIVLYLLGIILVMELYNLWKYGQ